MILNITELEKHTIDCYPQEMCGVIRNNIFIPVTNVADDPVNTFKFSQEDSLRYLDLPIVHSHCMASYKGDPRTPSYADMLSAENSGTAYGIVHCDGYNTTDILWFNTRNILPLLDRSYIPNVTDCFTLARDYYRLNRNIDFGLHPRPANWEDWNPMYIEQHFINCGFIEKEKNRILQSGDILLLNIGNTLVNHIGIVQDSTTFLHHLRDRISCNDSINKWKKHIKLILEYRG